MYTEKLPLLTMLTVVLVVCARDAACRLDRYSTVCHTLWLYTYENPTRSDSEAYLVYAYRYDNVHVTIDFCIL